MSLFKNSNMNSWIFNIFDTCETIAVIIFIDASDCPIFNWWEEALQVDFWRLFIDNILAF